MTTFNVGECFHPQEIIEMHMQAPQHGIDIGKLIMSHPTMQKLLITGLIYVAFIMLFFIYLFFYLKKILTKEKDELNVSDIVLHGFFLGFILYPFFGSGLGASIIAIFYENVIVTIPKFEFFNLIVFFIFTVFLFMYQKEISTKRRHKLNVFFFIYIGYIFGNVITGLCSTFIYLVNNT